MAAPSWPRTWRETRSADVPILVIMICWSLLILMVPYMTCVEKLMLYHVLWKIPAKSCLSLIVFASSCYMHIYTHMRVYKIVYIYMFASWYAPVLSQLRHLLGGLSTWDANGLSRTELGNWKQFVELCEDTTTAKFFTFFLWFSSSNFAALRLDLINKLTNTMNCYTMLHVC